MPSLSPQFLRFQALLVELGCLGIVALILVDPAQLVQGDSDIPPIAFFLEDLFDLRMQLQSRLPVAQT